MEVKECYEGGPAKRAGVKEGDIISAIDGEDITDTPIKDVVALIKKSGKESVVLTVHRENVESPMEIRTEITDVELPSVFHEMLDQDTGYIQITAFNGNTVTQYKAAFSDLKSRGMNRLVIDLRDNPGGLLNSVCDILRKSCRRD